MVVHGMVYDVSLYAEYHPGGIQMIMSGAGRDASALFNKYHAWVNPTFMLEKCCLGYLEDFDRGSEARNSGGESASDEDSSGDDDDAAAANV
jgi:cytochrome b involved in lipid metabolism